MYKSEVAGKGGIRARVVADSISEQGVRLTTLELRYPRFILAELNTHRMLSKSSSSSRAIPVKKMIEQVRTDPATPIHWGKNQPGMQASEECHNSVYFDIMDPESYDYYGAHFSRENGWAHAAQTAAVFAESYNESGYHKQVVNRLLEPFQFMNTVVTATEWDNFFFLRDHRDAQPEFRELAQCMKQAIDESSPFELTSGMFHTPYIRDDESIGADVLKVSSARCARVSYMNHNNEHPDIESDLDLFGTLVTLRDRSNP